MTGVRLTLTPRPYRTLLRLVGGAEGLVADVGLQAVVADAGEHVDAAGDGHGGDQRHGGLAHGQVREGFAAVGQAAHARFDAEHRGDLDADEGAEA